MKHLNTYLLLGLLSLTLACSKNEPELNIEIDFEKITIAKFPNGDREVGYTISVTQFGDIFLNEFSFTFRPYFSRNVLDEFSTTLPTAREFVQHTVKLSKAGEYNATVKIKRGNKEVSFSKEIDVP